MREVVDRHVGPRAARFVDRRVAGDAEQERDKRQAAILVPIERFHRSQEHVGYQVLRLVSRAGPRQAVAKDRVAVPLVELAERRRIAGLAALTSAASIPRRDALSVAVSPVMPASGTIY